MTKTSSHDLCKLPGDKVHINVLLMLFRCNLMAVMLCYGEILEHETSKRC